MCNSSSDAGWKRWPLRTALLAAVGFSACVAVQHEHDAATAGHESNSLAPGGADPGPLSPLANQADMVEPPNRPNRPDRAGQGQESTDHKARASGQDADLSSRITELEKALEQVKARVKAGEDVSARIAELEKQLVQLKSAAGEARGQAASGTKSQYPPAGVEGAPNPLQRNKEFVTGATLLDESFPGSLPIPGTDVRFKVGGYTKLDFIQDFDSVGDRFEFELATIPVDGTPEAALGGRTTMHAKESRLNFDFRSKARWQDGTEFPLQAFLEIDFFDDRESFALQPRLRHAYGVLGRFLAGRTWTISGDLDAIPGAIDFSGGDALYGGRVAQVRWQDRIGDRVTWAVGFEDPRTSIGNPSSLEGADRPRLPNFAGKARWTTKGGSHAQIGADLFQLDWQGGSAGPSDKELGYGLNLTGRWVLGDDSPDAFMGGGSYGEGSAHRVVSLGFDGGNDAVITPNGLDVMQHWQAYIGFSHYWTKSLNSTISTAWAELDNSPFQSNTSIHRAGSVHLNLIWFPYELVSTGVEVMWGERVNKDGASGDAWRLQFMFKFKFN